MINWSKAVRGSYGASILSWTEDAKAYDDAKIADAQAYDDAKVAWEVAVVRSWWKSSYIKWDKKCLSVILLYIVIYHFLINILGIKDLLASIRWV